MVVLGKEDTKMEVQKFESYVNKRNFFGKISIFHIFQELSLGEMYKNSRRNLYALLPIYTINFIPW